MIGLYYLHKQQMDEACAEWCEAAVHVLYEGKSGKNRFKYTLTRERTGLPSLKKTFHYKTLYQKIKRVSKLNLQDEVKGLRKCEKRKAQKLLQTVIKDVFGNLNEYLSADGNALKAKFEVCNVNIRREQLYASVYKALKGPMEELYNVMRDLKQDDVFEKLNIRTCPYCNRQYTFTLKPAQKGDPNTSPEFDHFYPKSDYPTLAICFYNLVPSCHCCNHGKGTKQLNINPYDYGFQGGFYLQDEQGNRMNTNDILSIKDETDIHVGYDGPFEEREDVKTLGLDQLYSMHSDYVQEIIDKVNAYNRASREGLADSFQGIFHTPEQVYDFVWGRHLELAEQEKMPLSKFTKDLLEQMGVKR